MTNLDLFKGILARIQAHIALARDISVEAMPSGRKGAVIVKLSGQTVGIIQSRRVGCEFFAYLCQTGRLNAAQLRWR